MPLIFLPLLKFMPAFQADSLSFAGANSPGQYAERPSHKATGSSFPNAEPLFNS